MSIIDILYRLDTISLMRAIVGCIDDLSIGAAAVGAAHDHNFIISSALRPGFGGNLKKTGL
jgi:hypothetical protein